MSASSRPPIDPAAARELAEPSARDRERIRETLDRSLARGSASPTVLRVDASMAERALGQASPVASAGSLGSRLALAKVLLPALLIGAGLGAIWARSRVDSHAAAAPHSQSLPVHVEDIDAIDLPVANQDRDAPGADEPAEFARRGAAGAVGGGGLQPSAASPSRISARPSRPARRSAAEPRARTQARLAADEPAPAAPPTAATVAEPEPEAPNHHLAEELRLMRAASNALAGGDIHRALSLLSEHAARFPNGALREERRALRVISLCKQGRSHFALAERDELLSSSPHSPLTARVREACEAAE